MSVSDFILISFAAITCIAGALLAFSRDLVRALILFFVVLFGTAALFVFSGADFVALGQIILYVGGVLIAILFGVMLTHKGRGMNPKTEWNFLFPGLALGSLLFISLMSLAGEWIRTNPQNGVLSTLPTAKEIGMRFSHDFLAPFEAVSFLLLVAMVAAAFISRKEIETKEDKA